MRSRGFIGQVTIGMAVAALLGIGGCVINGDWGLQAKFERTVELQQAMQRGTTFAVSTDSGSIRVAGEETGQAQVVATIEARAGSEEEAQELAEQVEIRLEETAQRVAVVVHKPGTGFNRSISISYRIVVPRQTHVECSSASGSVEAIDLTGNVNASSASGSAKAARIHGSVRLRSASGSVRCEGVAGGEVDIESASGSASLSDASQVVTCRVQSASGSAGAERIEADSLRVHSSSGSATASDAHAKTIALSAGSGHVSAGNVDCQRLTAEDGSGHISVTFLPSAPGNLVAEIHDSSGGVDVVLPPAFAGRVDLSAVSGSVHIDLPVSVRGEIGGRHVVGAIGEGTGSLSIHTASGSIHVR